MYNNKNVQQGFKLLVVQGEGPSISDLHERHSRLILPTLFVDPRPWTLFISLYWGLLVFLKWTIDFKLGESSGPSTFEIKFEPPINK